VTFALTIRTPHATLLEAEATSLRAEDEDGWFGVLPRRSELIAILTPGLLIATLAGQSPELFVALAGGMLHMADRRCLVLARDATASHELDAIAAEVAALLALRAQRRRMHQTLTIDLAKEIQRRIVRQGR
jgi:alternate F1F0 ATPase F1 subunit epsilon